MRKHMRELLLSRGWHTQVFHQGQREDDAHSDDDNEVVSIHEPVATCRTHTHSDIFVLLLRVYGNTQEWVIIVWKHTLESIWTHTILQWGISCCQLLHLKFDHTRPKNSSKSQGARCTKRCKCTGSMHTLVPAHTFPDICECVWVWTHHTHFGPGIYKILWSESK